MKKKSFVIFAIHKCLFKFYVFHHLLIHSFSQHLPGTHCALDLSQMSGLWKRKKVVSCPPGTIICHIQEDHQVDKSVVMTVTVTVITVHVFLSRRWFPQALAGSLPLTDMLLQIFKLNVLQEMESLW